MTKHSTDNDPADIWGQLIGSTVMNAHGARFTVTGAQWQTGRDLCVALVEDGTSPDAESLVPIRLFLDYFTLVSVAAGG